MKKKSVDTLIREAKAKSAKFLALTSCGLTELPESICELVQLERLDAWGNELKALPKNIGNLTQLTELSLAKNQFKWPWDVWAVHSLTQLNLSDNKVREISPQICELERLTFLDLSFNEIARLPEELYSLPALDCLDLTHNQLKTVPASLLQRMTKLSVLFLGDNREMRVIPPHILDHPSLEWLWLDHDQYRTLPAAVLKLGRPKIQVV